MSNTPIQIATDLSQVLERIEQKIDKLDEKFETKLDTLQKDITDLKVGQTKLEGELKALEAKVDGIGRRIDNQEFVNRGIVIGLIVTIIGGAAKLFGWVGNP
ncbi:MAG: hemolytic enterotoxin [Hydrococcus sp. RM1_1_31]|nr:hemolytic enterotoxin [Hydrococcus sp. RM1_1_31]